MTSDNFVRASSILYMLIPESFWYRIQQSEGEYLPIETISQGKIRCFRERLRMLETVNSITYVSNEPMWVMSLDEYRLPGLVKMETSPDGGTDPYVYGMIPRSAIVAVTVLQVEPSTGTYLWPRKRRR